MESALLMVSNWHDLHNHVFPLSLWESIYNDRTINLFIAIKNTSITYIFVDLCKILRNIASCLTTDVYSILLLNTYWFNKIVHTRHHNNMGVICADGVYFSRCCVFLYEVYCLAVKVTLIYDLRTRCFAMRSWRGAIDSQ